MSSINIQGFTVLPLYFSKENSGYHNIFIKEHSVRSYDEKKPPGKTLFAVNIPPYVDEDSLKRVFSVAGKVKSVYLQESAVESDNKVKSGFKVAYIVFNKHEELLKALKMQELDPLSSNENPVLVGLSKWVHQYNSSIYNHEKLSEEVNKCIKNSDKEEEEKKAHGKEEVDDAGWTVVTKKGRNPGFARKESVENKIIQKNKLKSRKKELKNFYTFQIKEQKMKNIIALRKNFQDSKEKVNLMKKMRNFKPF
ncbi:ribosomal RNA-processing protein 7 homolog A [Zophobas morio]|uniref:ribosomal RNA-processing protein 7 homolog A n=1 Tax=Zophobas morio TaxID=2755281 RepID=UPI0030837C82